MLPADNACSVQRMGCLEWHNSKAVSVLDWEASGQLSAAEQLDPCNAGHPCLCSVLTAMSKIRTVTKGQPSDRGRHPARRLQWQVCITAIQWKFQPQGKSLQLPIYSCRNTVLMYTHRQTHYVASLQQLQLPSA